MPARLSMIMVMKLSGSWRSRAADRILPMAALSDSEIPSVSFHSSVVAVVTDGPGQLRELGKS